MDWILNHLPLKCQKVLFRIFLPQFVSGTGCSRVSLLAAQNTVSLVGALGLTPKTSWAVTELCLCLACSIHTLSALDSVECSTFGSRS